MHYRVSIYIVIASILTVTVTAQTSRLAITHVNVIDSETGDILKDQDVIIEGNYITAISPAGKLNGFSKMEIVDSRNKFLMPGLWDMHTHLSYYGEDAFPLLVGYGILGVRDLGGDLNQIDAWRDEIVNGKRIGPVIYRAGPFIDGPKKMDSQRSSFTSTVVTAADAINAVKSLKLKTDFIKIHSRVPRDAFFAGAEQAKHDHIPLVVHVPVDVTVAEASDAGAWCIEHAESLLGKAIYENDSTKRENETNEAFRLLASSAGDSVFSKLQQNYTWYDPTLVALYRLKGSAYEKGLGPRLLPIITRLYSAGVRLVTGSDFGIKKAGIVPGIDLHEELVLFVEAGMTPLEAIQASTIRAAQCLKLDSTIGNVRPSSIANLILLDKNPLDDIRNTMNIRAIIMLGKIYTGKQLEQMQKFQR